MGSSTSLPAIAGIDPGGPSPRFDRAPLPRKRGAMAKAITKMTIAISPARISPVGAPPNRSETTKKATRNAKRAKTDAIPTWIRRRSVNDVRTRDCKRAQLLGHCWRTWLTVLLYHRRVAPDIRGRGSSRHPRKLISPRWTYPNPRGKGSGPDVACRDRRRSQFRQDDVP